MAFTFNTWISSGTTGSSNHEMSKCSIFLARLTAVASENILCPVKLYHNHLTDAVGVIGVNHELEVSPDGLPDGLDPPEILGDGEEPYLHLDSSEPGLLEGPGLLGTRPHTLPDVYGAGVLMVMSRLITSHLAACVTCHL